MRKSFKPKNEQNALVLLEGKTPFSPEMIQIRAVMSSSSARAY
jgi:hypothetical protein